MPQLLTHADVTISLTIQEDDSSPTEWGAEFAADVADMVDRYGLWGWCTVVVTARRGPFAGSSCLGGCSYKGPDDFRQDAYYTDMVKEAIEDLETAIVTAIRELPRDIVDHALRN